MKKIIENIRNKPEEHRDRIIWIIAAIVAGLLLITWLVVGNGKRDGEDQSFFQTFSDGINEGKNIVPQDINANNSNE